MNTWVVDADRSGYFDHVSKAKALEAVQVFAPREVHRLSRLRKAQIASEAERLAARSRWLPAVFRTPEPTIGAKLAQDAEAGIDAGGAEVEDAEEAHAAA